MSFENSRKLTILYGSQTGNAQDVAERVWRESKLYYFTGSVKAMDDYNISDLINEKYIVFICSTTGQGDEPDNMKNFWRILLRKNLPKDSLIHLKCCVLGLGDSSYVKFNFVAKRLNKRLMQLGADMFLPLALGDDQHDLGYDAVVDVWIENLWKTILIYFPLPDNLQPLNNNITIEPRWDIKTIKNPSNGPKNVSIYFTEAVQFPKNQFIAEIIENQRTTTLSHFQDVRLIKFFSQNVEYLPGDVLSLRPKNSPEIIEDFYDVLKTNGVEIDPETVIEITAKSSEMPVPAYLQNGITFQTLCEEYFDLSSIPRRYIFSVLAQLTTSDIEKEKCIEFTKAEGQNDLYNYCNRPRRNITEVLRDFPHAVKNITIDMLFEIMPGIKCRDFSIASSAKAHKNEIHILVAVVKYKTKLIKERLGLCSNWLANLKVGNKVAVWIKKGSFRFPYKENVPVIMVGPGTGVAPFRSFISEMDHLSIANSKNLVLIFGCRNKNEDFHFKDQFTSLQQENKLTLICAFSRDQENKIYVQHKIEENAAHLWEILKSKEVYIFIAGNSKNMPQSVREAFVNVCAKYLENDAENFIASLEKNGQYQTETWS